MILNNVLESITQIAKYSSIVTCYYFPSNLKRKKECKLPKLAY